MLEIKMEMEAIEKRVESRMAEMKNLLLASLSSKAHKETLRSTMKRVDVLEKALPGRSGAKTVLDVDDDDPLGEDGTEGPPVVLAVVKQEPEEPSSSAAPKTPVTAQKRRKAHA